MAEEKNAQWFADVVFKDESLNFNKTQKKSSLPPLLEKARALEPVNFWVDRATVFLEQGKLLADYEDDYEYHGDPVRYYPTYQSLTDEELRGYFTWRAKVRKGVFPQTSLSFIFLYIYEIINNIGVNSVLDGYAKLIQINLNYAWLDTRLDWYLQRWMMDYVIYYNINSVILENSTQVVNDQCIAVLENIENEPADKIIDAVKELAPKWLKRSKFYSNCFEDMDQIIYRVLKQMTRHYAKGFKKTFVEQFFGILAPSHIHMFSSAVFADPLKRSDYSYSVDSQCVYKCENGIWTVNRRTVSWRGLRKLENLLKTIDSLMRDAYGYGHPIKAELATKWIINLINNEIEAFIAEKAAGAKKKLTIDYSRLNQIRIDAADTQEKLIVEEEEEIQVEPEPVGQELALAPAEYRLIHSLLYNEDLSWVKNEGYLLSVLIDGINDKFYETFADSVVDDAPQVIEDYAESLKELIPQ